MWKWRRRGRPATASVIQREAGRPGDEGAGLRDWQVGDQVAGVYTVRGVLGQGGMGLVHLVRHEGWGIDLAVKSPHRSLFATTEDQERFVAEAQTWVDLGLHPHVCACHYVSIVDGLPRVFAEHVAGGSLREWIDDGRLYAGGAEQALPRLLDIAIQLARGLEHAHQRGVVHQDVKPANVLLTVDGTAKITDFGLARAGEFTRRPDSLSGDGTTVLVTAGGMTPAYASPEQAAMRPIGRRSDIWSYAATVLEMFVGGMAWRQGPDADAALAAVAELGDAAGCAVPIPSEVAHLLGQCLQQDPTRRPASAADVSRALSRIYEARYGRAYPRSEPAAAQLRADEMNNRGLSLLDLGLDAEAATAFAAALEVDPRHPETTYNLGLRRWRRGEIADDDLLSSLEAVLGATGDVARVGHLIALVHLERGDPVKALEQARAAQEGSPGDPLIDATIRRAQHAVARSVETSGRLAGHGDTVSAVGLSGNGRFAVTGSWDATIRGWDLETGDCLRVLSGHDGPVTTVSVSIDGREVLSASSDSTVRLWQVQTGGCRQSLRLPNDRRPLAHLALGGRVAVTSTTGGQVTLWDLATGDPLHLLASASPTWGLAADAEGRLLLTGEGPPPISYEGQPKPPSRARLWDLTTGQVLGDLDGHDMTVTGVALSANGQRAVTTSMDRTMRWWDTRSGTCLSVVTDVVGLSRIGPVAISGDGRHAVTGGDDGTVRLWDLAAGRCVRTLTGHDGPVLAVACTPDLRHVLSGGRDRTARWWSLDPFPTDVAPGRVARPRSHAELGVHAGQAATLLESARGALAADDVSTAHATLTALRALPGHERDTDARRMWQELTLRTVPGNVRDIVPTRTVPLDGGVPWSLAVSPDGTRALVGDEEGVVRVWDLDGDDEATVLTGHPGRVGAVSVSSDGQHAVSGHDGNQARGASLWLWELDSGRSVQVLDMGLGGVFELHLGANIDHVTALVARDLEIRDVASGRVLRRIDDEPASFAFTADERYLLAGGGAGPEGFGKVRLWDLSTGEVVRTLLTNASAVDLSLDGRYALTGDGQGTVLLWDMLLGTCLRGLPGHTAGISSLSLSGDGRLGLTTCGDWTVRLWDVARGECLHQLPVRSRLAGLSQDGRRILAVSQDRSLQIWDVDRELELGTAAGWDEGAQTHLDTFLTLQTPWAAEHSAVQELLEEDLWRALDRQGNPAWTDGDLHALLRQLRTAGYGWIPAERVDQELRARARTWTGPPSWPPLARGAEARPVDEPGNGLRELRLR